VTFYSNHVFKDSFQTAATEMLQGEKQKHTMREPEIMADTIYSMFCQETSFTGNFVLDDQYLKKYHNITDFTSYQCDAKLQNDKLQGNEDFFKKSVEGMSRHNKKYL
jgi:hypothetical protein